MRALRILRPLGAWPKDFQKLLAKSKARH